jgi:hypothetical protein
VLLVALPVALTLGVWLAGGVTLAGVFTGMGLGTAFLVTLGTVLGVLLAVALPATGFGARLAAASPTAEPLLVLFPAVTNAWLD